MIHSLERSTFLRSSLWLLALFAVLQDSLASRNTQQEKPSSDTSRLANLNERTDRKFLSRETETKIRIVFKTSYRPIFCVRNRRERRGGNCLSFCFSSRTGTITNPVPTPTPAPTPAATPTPTSPPSCDVLRKFRMGDELLDSTLNDQPDPEAALVSSITERKWFTIVTTSFTTLYVNTFITNPNLRIGVNIVCSNVALGLPYCN